MSMATPGRSRGYLPHVEGQPLIQHITFRLADALPASVLEGWREDLGSLSDEERRQCLRQRVETFADAGHGSCVLREAKCAAICEEAFFHGNGERYALLAWCVMPNHCHVLIHPAPDWALSRIVHSWKSYTAHVITRQMRGPGKQAQQAVWQREYWDRFIRDERHYRRAVDYIHQNPVAAGLCSQPEDWRFSSAWGGRRSR